MLKDMADTTGGSAYDPTTDSQEILSDALQVLGPYIFQIDANIGTPSDLGTGATLSANEVDVKTDTNNVRTVDVPQIQSDIATTEANIRGADSDDLKNISDEIEAETLIVNDILDILENRLEIDETTMTLNLYDDSGSGTPIKVWPLTPVLLTKLTSGVQRGKRTT
jgi:hypothetical protein